MSSGININGRIQITMTNKTTTQTLELPFRERHILDIPTSATGSTCIFGINPNQLPTSSFNLVRQHLQEATPTCIVNTFSEMMIFNHISNIQFFNRNNFELFDNFKRGFMEKVLSLIKNSFVEFSNFKSFFFPISRTFLFPTQSSLKFKNFLFTFPQKFGIFNFSSIRQNSKTFNSNINTNMVIFNFNLFNRNILTRKNSKPTNSSSFDSKGFHFSFWNSVKDNRHISNFTNRKFFIREQLKSALGKGYTFVFIKSFKSGKSCFAFFLFNPSKEMIESIINSLTDILQNLTMNRNIKIFCEFIQIKLGEISFVFFVSINFDFKKFIIDETTIRNSFIQFINLFMRGIYSKPKILRCHRKLNTNTFIYFSIQKNVRRNLTHLHPEGWSLLAS